MSIKKYVQLPLGMQNAITTNAGLILSDFDPEKAYTAEELKKLILYATAGGMHISCAAIFRDAGADIDNCPKNAKELLDIEAWECKIHGTALTVTDDSTTHILGAADETVGATDKATVAIKPRMSVDAVDFQTIWYVCAYGTTGGFIAVKLDNALNKGGFSLKTEDGKKGRFAFSYVGHTSMDAPDVVPFTFYLKAGEASAAEQVALDMT